MNGVIMILKESNDMLGVLSNRTINNCPKCKCFLKEDGDCDDLLAVRYVCKNDPTHIFVHRYGRLSNNNAYFFHGNVDELEEMKKCFKEYTTK
jgi:hypothetical protein